MERKMVIITIHEKLTYRENQSLPSFEEKYLIMKIRLQFPLFKNIYLKQSSTITIIKITHNKRKRGVLLPSFEKKQNFIKENYLIRKKKWRQ